MKAIRVYIADDHPVVRSGMVRLLKMFSRVEEVKDAANGKELISLCAIQKPDAVILDIEMPVMAGHDAARFILDHYTDVKILMLTMHTEDVFISRMIEMGVHGFLSKSSESEEVEKALYSIVDKDFYRNEIIEMALKRFSRKSKGEPGIKLSARELEILLLICNELTPGEISQRLQISEKTFFNHRSNILEKAGARNNVGLFKYALERGYYHLAN